MPTIEKLRELQSLPLEMKYQLTVARIMEFYQYYDGEVVIMFSGGKDSTVLLDIVRSVYPDVKAIFHNTGIEFPEVVQFVKTKENVTFLRPEKNFKQILQEYGYPIISKQIATAIDTARRRPDGKTREFFDKFLNDPNAPYSSNGKYAFLINAPFKISAKCCHALKKKTFSVFAKKTRFKGGYYIGTTCEESDIRTNGWLKTGCNDYSGNGFSYGISKPLSFWKEQDILEYIKIKKLNICSIYGEIVEKNNKLECTKMHRTGCIFCLFGPIRQILTGRFNHLEILKKDYPKLYEYAMKPWSEGGLGYRDILTWLRDNYVENMKNKVKNPKNLNRMKNYQY